MPRIDNPVLLYSNEDKNNLLSILDKKKKQAEKQANKIIEPTLNKRKEMLKIVGDFIKLNKLKIYGGHAQNLTIKKYDELKQFYIDPDDLHDYDTYSTDPINDGIKLCNFLYDAGFKDIIFTEALHHETYSIKIDKYVLCDLSYVPKKIFYNIPFDTIDGFIVCKPSFYIIDFLRMFVDPISSSFRWDKQLERFMLIQEVFPIPEIKDPLLINDEKLYPRIEQQNVTKLIKEFLKKNKNLLVTGLNIYNKYLSLIKDKKKSRNSTNENLEFKKIPKPVYSLICTHKFKETVVKFMEYLKISLDKNLEISVREKYPFFQFNDWCAEIYINKKLVAAIYKNNNICIPFVTINEINYCSFQYNLMFLYTQSFYSRIYSNIKDKELTTSEENFYSEHAEYEFKKLASKISLIRNIYFKKYNLTFLDESPFEDFIVFCEGDIITSSKLKKQLDKNYVGFKYVPSKKRKEHDDRKYSNSSGWYVYNKQDLKIKID